MSLNNKNSIGLGITALGLVGIAAIFNGIDENAAIEAFLKILAMVMAMGGGLMGLLGVVIGKGIFAKIASLLAAGLGLMVFLSVIR